MQYVFWFILIYILLTLPIKYEYKAEYKKPEFKSKIGKLIYIENGDTNEIIYEKRYEQLGGYSFGSDSCLFVFLPKVSGDKMITCNKIKIIKDTIY